MTNLFFRNRNTVKFLGIWESVFNPGFVYGEFAIIKTLTRTNLKTLPGATAK